MNKDEKYLELVRRLHTAERNLQDVIPINLIDATWESDGVSESPYKKGFEDLLPTELHKIEYRRRRQIREDCYWAIYDYLGEEEFKIFYKEYHKLDKNDGSYKSNKMFDKNKDMPLLKPANPIGEIVWGGDDEVLFIDDKMPVTYQVLDDLPINDDNVKDEAYRVKVNSRELTINYDMYAFMEYIRNNYKDERFHFATLLRDLDINKVITKDYRGKPNDLFQSRKGLLQVLFKKLNAPKGYWISRVQSWYD